MKQITLEELLEAGCHFGHQVTRSNPKARDYVFEARDNIQIIDLAKTKEGLEDAGEFIRNLGSRGESLLVVGTKRQAREIILNEIGRAKEVLEKEGKSNPNRLFYITQRWIGGILTNFPEVSKNFKKIKDLEFQITNPEEKAKYTKKEIGLFEKEKQRLENFYKGVMEMNGKPGALFIIDSHLEDLAVREAASVNVQTAAIVDTNADPYLIDHPIPANDDAVGSIQLIVSYIIDAYVEGLKSFKVKTPEDAAKETAKRIADAQAPKAQNKTENLKVQEVEKPKEEKKQAKKVVKTKAPRETVKKETSDSKVQKKEKTSK